MEVDCLGTVIDITDRLPVDITDYDDLIDDLLEIYYVHKDPYSVQVITDLMDEETYNLVFKRIWKRVAEQQKEEAKDKRKNDKG